MDVRPLPHRRVPFNGPNPYRSACRLFALGVSPSRVFYLLRRPVYNRRNSPRYCHIRYNQQSLDQHNGAQPVVGYRRHDVRANVGSNGICAHRLRHSDVPALLLYEQEGHKTA